MSLHRFFVSPSLFSQEEASAEKQVALSGEIVHQLARVLRLGPGDRVLLLDGTGREYLVELKTVNKNGTAEGRVVSEARVLTEPENRITLYQALLKGEKFDFLLQKGTEIGISRFVPVITERVVGGGSATKLERWRKIVREAAEQSRRGIVPEVTEPVTFEVALAALAKEDLALMAWEEEEKLSLREALQAVKSQKARPAKTGVLIGPEGGLSPKEAGQARAAGVKTIKLGSRILRAETAGMVAAALILYEQGDI